MRASSNPNAEWRKQLTPWEADRLRFWDKAIELLVETERQFRKMRTRLQARCQARAQRKGK